MKYCLDTDTIIYYLNDKKKVKDKILLQKKENLVISVINQAELIFVAYNSAKKQENPEIINAFVNSLKIYNFDKKSAQIFGKIKSDLKKQGDIIDDMDLMIASICINNNLVLVTNNLKHFSKIKNLKLENWTE